MNYRFFYICKELWKIRQFRQYMIWLGYCLLALLIFILARHIFFILLFLGLNAIAGVFMKPMKRFPIGFEFATFSTIICGVAYGSKVGLLMGALAIVTMFIFQRRVSFFSIVLVPCYLLIGYLAGAFAETNILTLGMTLTVIYNLISVFGVIFLFHAKITKGIIFSATNIPFNFFLFNTIAPLLLGVM